jgi:hypothetical protein
MHLSEHILLVRPSRFIFNEQTAGSNAFQHETDDRPASLAKTATSEFDRLTEKLTSANVDLTIVDDTAYPAKPDAVFPNNWISTHRDGTVVIYPMFAPNRRPEKRTDIKEGGRSESLRATKQVP